MGHDDGAGGEGGVLGVVIGREGKLVGADEARIGEVGSYMGVGVQAHRAVGGLRDDSRPGASAANRQENVHGLVISGIGGHGADDGCGIEVGIAAAGTVVTGIAADDGAPEEGVRSQVA